MKMIKNVATADVNLIYEDDKKTQLLLMLLLPMKMIGKHDLMVYNDMLHLQRVNIYIVQDVSVLGITFVGNVKQHSKQETV